ncbi:hypothetical protein C8J98_102607 [Luteibacter sp. OK325]|uniref:energy transducer TonB n=1 Tax=Luteibacter sp. OK325 TaxID=2135670 RepID=UPI000D371138|nr:energy transducer TonB [Luteibacter sp. OK325]PTR34419.1 hypothetical protein C8J98_102607 [Luteibacter sp. OK325]
MLQGNQLREQGSTSVSVFFGCMLLGGFLALTGCQTATSPPVKGQTPDKAGAVSYSVVPTASSGAYQLKHSEHAFGAQPIARDAPVYPASMVGQQLPPVSIHVKAIIDEQGHVTDVRDLDVASTPSHAAFFAACREAVLRWQFTPMTVVEDVEDARGNMSQKRKNAPFSLDYAFRFELVDGKPTVTPQP